MATTQVNGLRIGYEIIGDGPKTAIVTPGGRFSKESEGLRGLAENLARDGYRTVIWDRPNCGESDICFEGESESILNADTLAGLLKTLDMAPALVIGGSAGSRVSLLAALRHPEVVRKLAILWITGDAIGLSGLVGVYCGSLQAPAKIGGMEAVAQVPEMARLIERNPANREKLMALDVEEFCATMQRWGATFLPEPGSPVPGLKPDDYARIAMPVMVFRSGQSDPHHPRYTSEQVHALLPNASLAEPPWGDREWIERMLDPSNELFSSWHMLAPQLAEFDGQA